MVVGLLFECYYFVSSMVLLMFMVMVVWLVLVGRVLLVVVFMCMMVVVISGCGFGLLLDMLILFIMQLLQLNWWVQLVVLVWQWVMVWVEILFLVFLCVLCDRLQFMWVMDRVLMCLVSWVMVVVFWFLICSLVLFCQLLILLVLGLQCGDSEKVLVCILIWLGWVVLCVLVSVVFSVCFNVVCMLVVLVFLCVVEKVMFSMLCVMFVLVLVDRFRCLWGDILGVVWVVRVRVKMGKVDRVMRVCMECIFCKVGKFSLVWLVGNEL